MNETKTELKLIHMEDVISKEVSWLWYPYIPFGKITVIEGDPGEGKTTLILKIAALLSKGLPLPCTDDIPYEPMAVIYQTAEDGLEDTIKPRLEQAGADCSKIRAIDESEKELTMSDERLEQAIIETNAKLIILDPIQAYIGATDKGGENLWVAFPIQHISAMVKVQLQVRANYKEWQSIIFVNTNLMVTVLKILYY